MGAQDQLPRDDDDLLKRVAALEKVLGTVGGTAASAAELSARATYSAANSGFSLAGGATSGVTNMNCSVTFTLADQRAVLIIASSSVILSAAAGGSVTGLMNGAATGPSTVGYGTTNVQLGSAGTSNLNSGMVLSNQKVLPAGTWTMGLTAQLIVSGSGGNATVNGATLVVLVLGKA